MAYYKTCPLCGANLDPMEKCDCQERAEQLRKKFELITTVSDNGQTAFNFKEERQWEMKN